MRLRPTEPVDAAKLGAGLADALGAREHVDVTIPRTKVTGKMRLLGRDETIEVKASTRRLFKTKDLLDDKGQIVAIAIDDWNAEIAVRHLAVAVRDPNDATKPLASLEEWRECDDEQIGGLWNGYQDMRERLDPLGDHEDSLVLSDGDVEMMRAAVKKKEPSVLMSFGSRKLAIFAIISAAPPAS